MHGSPFHRFAGSNPWPALSVKRHASSVEKPDAVLTSIMSWSWEVQVGLLMAFSAAFVGLVLTMVLKSKTATQRQWRLLLLLTVASLGMVFAAIKGVSRF